MEPGLVRSRVGPHSSGDDTGWGLEQYYTTIQYMDLNGDGLPDVCAVAETACFAPLIWVPGPALRLVRCGH